jgi:hypothetical protein
MAKKSKKALPKRVAGVKLPKPLRKGVAQFLNSQDGRTLAMEAVAATVALAGGKRAAKRIKDDPLSSDADPLGAAHSMASAFSYALGEGVRSFTDALRQGKGRADAHAAWPPGDSEVGEAKKKSSVTGDAPSAH